MIESIVIKAGVAIKVISPLIESAVIKNRLSAVTKIISALIEVCFVKRDSAIVIITAETKAPIGVICKARAAHIDVRTTEIHVRVLCSCIAVIKAGLIDSDIIGRIKIESGPTAISV